MRLFETNRGGGGLPGRKSLPVHFTKRPDERVAVLASDFSILGAMPSVDTRLAHADLRLHSPKGKTVTARGQQQ